MPQLLNWTRLQRHARRLARSLLATLPGPMRRALVRRTVDCEPVTEGRLEVKIAQTQEELEQCFALLHDAYVASGFMRPHPSGLRVTPYHALPTTTTLCAKVDGQVVGTLSIVREGAFGFPMQSVFDISGVRAREGRIAEISALAIHPRWRRTGGGVLFPLMKFMYGYCTRYFDTRHLVIAVNPAHIEMYESVLFFRRLTQTVVDRYDFVNGAPAVGATLDLHEAPALFEAAYGRKSGRRNLHRYFVHTELPEIQYPSRPWHTSNDPVLTPALLHHFFHVRTQGFAQMDERRLRLLHALYRGPEWAAVLPPLPPGDPRTGLRREPRHSMKCPATLTPLDSEGSAVRATVVEISGHGFLARTMRVLHPGAAVTVEAELAPGVSSRVRAVVVRQAAHDAGPCYGFQVETPDEAWDRCVAWLEQAEAAPITLTAAPEAATAPGKLPDPLPETRRTPEGLAA
jgi:GNAT superfamily N-acetyltransferase